MKPVAILRHAASEGPGHFASFLDARSIPWRLVAIDAGEAVPKNAARFSGIALMGGPMSVNDELPWIARVVELIRDAVRRDAPVLGHCLGGQLISKAFGGTVGPAAAKEIGWGRVEVADNAVARDWFGEHQSFEAFHWHGEAFSIPPGATRVLGSALCANQGFALGKHLGLQCHVEMTSDMVRGWCDLGRTEIEASAASPGVQRPETILQGLEQRIAALHEVADLIYGRWSERLSRGN
jgi:GMP synthase-like glutamine amidotransferase